MTNPKVYSPISNPPELSRHDYSQQDAGIALATDYREIQQRKLFLEDIVYPQPGYTVSNSEKSRHNTIIYIPGIMTGTVEYMPGEATSQAVFAAQQLSNIRGKPVHYVHNQSDGLGVDLAKCAACAAALRLGGIAEREAVSRSIYMIDQAVNSGDFPIEICCHSGGNQVLDVALKLYSDWLLQNGNTAESVRNIRSNITIYRYGSPQDNAPGTKSFVFEDEKDAVTKLRPLIDTKNKILDLITGKLRDPSNVVRVSKNYDDISAPFDYPIDIASHSIVDSYLKNNDRYYDRSLKHLRPEGRAYALYKSIENGFFSDPEFEKIISLMLTSPEISKVDKMAFAVEFSRLAPPPQRRIGNYYLSQNSIDLLNQKSKGF